VTAAFACGLAACGGSAGATAGSPAATAGAPEGRDTSTAAEALIGHWRDGNGSDSFSYKYDVKEEDAAAKEVLLTTHRLESDGTTHTDVQDIRFTFLNADFTQLKYGMGGLTSDYVDAQQKP